MGTECCGKVRQTTFCPDCGRRMHHSGLLKLLEHCHTSRCGAEGLLRVAEESFEEDPTNEARRQHLEQRRIALAKWQNWETELGQLLEGK